MDSSGAHILASSITRKQRERPPSSVLYVLSLSCHTKTLCACGTAWVGPFRIFEAGLVGVGGRTLDSGQSTVSFNAPLLSTPIPPPSLPAPQVCVAMAHAVYNALWCGLAVCRLVHLQGSQCRPHRPFTCLIYLPRAVLCGSDTQAPLPTHPLVRTNGACMLTCVGGGLGRGEASG